MPGASREPASENASPRRARGVVVTGLGCVTPVGQTAPVFWGSLLGGKTGAAPVASFDTTPYRTHIGCEVKDFESQPGAAALAASRPAWAALGRATKLALVAAAEALARAGLRAEEAGRGLGISLGTTMGEPCFLDQLALPGAGAGAGAAAGRSTSPESNAPWEEVLSRNTWSIAGQVARELGIRGVQASLPAACSAGNYAVGLAFDLIRGGELDAAVAGGTEAFSESAFAGFSRLGALAAERCQPFDRDRQGLLIGEGAGVLVLEEEEHARRRGATILARILGYGLSCDAHHITGPHPEGEGAAACMRNALRDAGASPDEVGYICCHGTGTRQNDKIEALAIHRVFGDRARALPASSIKAATGHMMGAASAVEAVACVLALQHGVLPPTWNHVHRDPECDLDIIPNEPRPVRVDLALNNSYAFGGNNACVAFARV